MYYTRHIAPQISILQKGFPIISITGPRQSGKTTFWQHHFSSYSYHNLENPQTRELIATDPQQFLKLWLPELLSYIQAHVDKKQVMGSIIISGLQNLLISETISQSLAGRASYQNLFPFSLSEFKNYSCWEN